MIKNSQNNKQKENRENINLENKRVVIEPYNHSVNKNWNKSIKINNKIYNLKNIDNNMSRGNLNENDNNKIINNKNFQQSVLSQQENFYIISHNKKFDLSSLINDSTINFCLEKKEEISKNKKIKEPKTVKSDNRNKNEIYSFYICIEGNYNLKSKNIQMTKSIKNHNLVHLELTDLKSSQNINIEKEKNNLINSLEIVSTRWKEAQQMIKTSLSYINQRTTMLSELEKYNEELISKIKFETNKLNDNNNWYIVLKQDIKSEENQIIHKIINASSKKDFENAFNQFIFDDKENNSNLVNNINISEKKKSKFNTQNNLNQNSNNIKNLKLEYYCPILILNYLQLKNFINEIEKNLKVNKETKPNNNENIIEEKISFNIKAVNKMENKNKQKQIVKNLKSNNMIIKENNDLEIDKIKKNKENKIKTQKKDFGQSTPISLLKEKYFIYAVSKWSKYSSINSEIKIFIKKTGCKYKSEKFESDNLNLTSFYLTIGKVLSERPIKPPINNSNHIKKNIFTNRINKISNENNVIPKTKSFISKVNKNDKEISTIKKRTKSKSKLKKK